MFKHLLLSIDTDVNRILLVFRRLIRHFVVSVIPHSFTGSSNIFNVVQWRTKQVDDDFFVQLLKKNWNSLVIASRSFFNRFNLNKKTEIFGSVEKNYLVDFVLYVTVHKIQRCFRLVRQTWQSQGSSSEIRPAIVFWFPNVKDAKNCRYVVDFSYEIYSGNSSFAFSENSSSSIHFLSK